jgi:heptaprenyl diphosphate synthase
MAAVGSILFAVEEVVLLPIPFFKLGLANVVTLMVLIGYGFREALAVVVLRVFVGSLLIGTLFQPNFLFSMAGGLASALVMGFVIRWGRGWFGLVGVSILGALAKNAAQLLIAYGLLVRQAKILSLLPLFFLVSIGAGTVVGLITGSLMKKIIFPRAP